MAKPSMSDQLLKFEEHMIVLRSAIRTDDTRLMAIACVRMAIACLQFAALPRLGDSARDEWKRGPAMAFAKWLNGDSVEPAEFKQGQA